MKCRHDIRRLRRVVLTAENIASGYYVLSAKVGDAVWRPASYDCEAHALVCYRCGEWLSLGPARDDGEHAAAVAMELRAAELFVEHLTFASHEQSPWTWTSEAIGGAYVCAVWEPGEHFSDLLEGAEMEAGYLAQFIEGDKCEHTSDNEHDPCNCDDDCCTHVETIASLRSQLTTAQRELAEARAEVERLTKQNDVLGMLAAQDHQARDKIRTNWVNEEREWFAERDRLTAERDEARGEVERLREQMMHKAQHLLDTVYREQWQRDTAEAIAAWLEGKATAHGERLRKIKAGVERGDCDEHGWAESYGDGWADDIRRGKWRPSPATDKEE